MCVCMYVYVCFIADTSSWGQGPPRDDVVVRVEAQCRSPHGDFEESKGMT